MTLVSTGALPTSSPSLFLGEHIRLQVLFWVQSPSVAESQTLRKIKL